MASKNLSRHLNPDEFAFRFLTNQGVEATELGLFLQRAATIARKSGAELQVTAIEAGTVSVIMKTLRAIASRSRREFNQAPISTTEAAVGLAEKVVAAIVAASLLTSDSPTPLARAGAGVVNNTTVQNIQLVTRTNVYVIMDVERAAQVRVRMETEEPKRLAAPDVLQIADHADRGTLTGTFLEIDGELHFRPDGHRYIVPVDLIDPDELRGAFHGAHVRVRGELQTYRGQPQGFTVRSVAPL